MASRPLLPPAFVPFSHPSPFLSGPMTSMAGGGGSSMTSLAAVAFRDHFVSP